MKAYNEKIQNKLSETAWAASCGSWYKTDEGKIVNNYPGYGIEEHLMMARPDYSDFKNNLKSILKIIFIDHQYFYKYQEFQD